MNETLQRKQILNLPKISKTGKESENTPATLISDFSFLKNQLIYNKKPLYIGITSKSKQERSILKGKSKKDNISCLNELDCESIIKKIENLKIKSSIKKEIIQKVSSFLINVSLLEMINVIEEKINEIEELKKKVFDLNHEYKDNKNENNMENITTNVKSKMRIKTKSNEIKKTETIKNEVEELKSKIEIMKKREIIIECQFEDEIKNRSQEADYNQEKQIKKEIYKKNDCLFYLDNSNKSLKEEINRLNHKYEVVKGEVICAQIEIEKIKNEAKEKDLEISKLSNMIILKIKDNKLLSEEIRKRDEEKEKERKIIDYI